MDSDNSHIKDPRRYGGFSLKNVIWGYRHIFESLLEQLFAEGALGPEKREVTERVFGLLKRADQGCFDHVLKEFLCALNRRTRWLMDVPGLFSDVVETGHDLAKSKLHHGVAFFRAFGEGAFGDSPDELRLLMTLFRRLREDDAELAMAFLQGYRALTERLDATGIERYAREGRRLFFSNRRRGLSFMAGKVAASESLTRLLSRECRLEDVKAELERMLRALAGFEVEIADLSQLDSDELLEHGAGTVCLYRWLYLPATARTGQTFAQNRRLYLITTIIAAGMLAHNAFPRIHGRPEYRTCRDLCGGNLLQTNLFRLLDTVRVLRRIRMEWPGAQRLLDHTLRMEFNARPPASATDVLFADALRPGDAPTRAARALRHAADASVNAFDAANRVNSPWAEDMLTACPGLDAHPLRTLPFLPDYFYPGETASPPSNQMVADLKDAAKRRAAPEAKREDRSATQQEEGAGDDASGKQKAAPAAAAEACFVYDEWSQTENDYYRNYCRVHERTPGPERSSPLPPDLAQHAERVRRLFEQLKPQIARKEKYLEEGDAINHELLMDYRTQRRAEPDPRVHFYEKPAINRRDVAVLILLDVSGSTGQSLERGKVIDIEKHAAVVFAEGLASLGDSFSVCGFSGSGTANTASIPSTKASPTSGAKAPGTASSPRAPPLPRAWGPPCGTRAGDSSTWPRGNGLSS